MGKKICIIPARGGSKRVPKKNIKLLNGKPLLVYSIEAALKSEVFDRIVVSSDEDEILKIGEQHGAEPLKREAELAGDKATVFSVFQSILTREEIKNEYESFMAMLPTCPFKTARHVKEAYELFHQHGMKASVISTTKFDYPPQFGFTRAEEDEIIMTHPEAFDKTTRSQDMPEIVHNNGAFWIASIQNYLENKTFYKGKMLGYEMDAIHSYDIDYPYQFEIAEILAKKIANGEL